MQCATTNRTQVTNLGVAERWASIVGGAALVSCGMKKGSVLGRSALAILGGDLIYTGLTGYTRYFKALGLKSSKTARSQSSAIPYQHGIRVDTAITIQKSREELFSFWRDLENLPRFMRHLHSVTRIDDRRSHWIAQGPGGKMLEWDAEIISEQLNERIGWRSLPGSDLSTAGSVHFKEAPGGRGTEVEIELQYVPPAGALGAAYAKLLGLDPADQIKDDLRRLKQMLETGETATIDGQAHGKDVLHRQERRVRPRRANRGAEDRVNAASEESFPASDPPSWNAHRPEEMVS
jgi:uncharacterized membrane protein